jgi:hypothetical protein
MPEPFSACYWPRSLQLYCALSCIVLYLEAKSGLIEFEGFGFKFRGASGEIILWVICFLAIMAAIKALW